MGIFDTVRNAWKIPELKKKLLYTLLLLVIFRLGCAIPIPGMEKNALSQIFGSGTSLFSFLNIISGRAAENATIFAMSISPYINASIIIQLLTIAIPALERMAKDGGEEGRKKLGQITRYTTVGLGLFQAFFLTWNIRNALIGPVWLSFIVVIASLTAGTAFLMWLGEQITEKGVGNGISLLIFAGIVSNGPNAVVSLYETFINGMDNKLIGAIYLFIVIAVFVALIVFVIYITEAERRISVQYAKRVVGRKMYGGHSTHIPLKINSSGVLPIIFAMSILAFPSTIIGLFFPNADNGFVNAIKNFTGTGFYPLVNALLVVAFTFFYSMVYFNPNEIAANLKKNGGFVPGIRPGKPTADYIKSVSNRITLVGALFLAFITVIPSILQIVLGLISATFKSYNLWFGGTSLLILVGVALETVKQIESQMLMRNYKGFLE